MVRVTIRPGMHHREDLAGGDVYDASEDELREFGDKFVVLEDQPEPEPEPAPEADPWENVSATETAIALAKEHGLLPHQIQGSGAGGRILKADVAEAVDGGA